MSKHTGVAAGAAPALALSATPAQAAVLAVAHVDPTADFVDQNIDPVAMTLDFDSATGTTS